MKSRNSFPVRLTIIDHAQLSKISVLHYGGLEKQFEDMVQKFIRISPWSAWPPLSWKRHSHDSDETMIIAFVALSDDTREIMLATLLQVNRINRHTLDHSEVTPSIFLNTAIHWWTTFVYPRPQAEQLHS